MLFLLGYNLKIIFSGGGGTFGGQGKDKYLVGESTGGSIFFLGWGGGNEQIFGW